NRAAAASSSCAASWTTSPWSAGRAVGCRSVCARSWHPEPVLDPLYLATAAEAALLAGRIHLRHFRQPLAIGRKGRIDLVTAADLEAERAIRALIAARFPDHEVLGEELTSGLAAPGAR